MAYHSGWNVYLCDPGALPEPQHCRVCQEKMEVTRNVSGPTSFVGAISGSKRLHDRFSCPHSDAAWHEQVYQLRRAQQDTPSGFLATLFEEEIRQILETRQPTKTTPATDVEDDQH